MRLGKLLIVSAAVAALAGVMATGAFAAEISAEYADGVVTISNCPTFEGDKTLLVLNTGEEGEALTSVTENDIKQIDQQADGYTDVVVGDLPAGTYEVRVGGDGNIATCLFEVEGETPENPYYTDGTVLIGDATCNGEINGEDALVVADYTIGTTDVSKDALQAMDTTENGQIAGEDALIIVDYTVGNATSIGTKTIGERTTFVEVE